MNAPGTQGGQAAPWRALTADGLDMKSRHSNWERAVHMKGHRVLLGIAIVASITFPIIETSTGWAAESQCGSSTAKYNGKTFHPPTNAFIVRGAKARIEIKAPAVCTSIDSGSLFPFSAGTVLLGPNGNQTLWAQVGYERHSWICGVCLRFFYQYKGSSGNPHTSFFGQPQYSEVDTFTVSRYTSDGLIHLLIAASNNPCGSDTDCVAAPADMGLWGTRWDAEYFTELNYLQNDFPGVSTNKEDFTNVQEKDNGTPGQWSSQPWANYWHWTDFYGTGCSWGKHENLDSSTHFAVWTSPLNHTGC